MTFYRSRPTIVEAVQIQGHEDGKLDFSVPHAWITEARAKHHTDIGSISEGAGGSFDVLTEDGTKNAVRGDWITRDGAGRIDVMKRDEFPITYEPA